MVKDTPIIKVDTAENWAKAINYIPDVFTMLVYTYDNGSPRIKMGDGIHKVNDLPFLVKPSEVDGSTLIL